jgi:hypothetical protein
MIGLASGTLWKRLTIIQIWANQGLLWLVMQKHSEKKSRGVARNITKRNIVMAQPQDLKNTAGSVSYPRHFFKGVPTPKTL